MFVNFVLLLFLSTCFSKGDSLIQVINKPGVVTKNEYVVRAKILSKEAGLKIRGGYYDEENQIYSFPIYPVKNGENSLIIVLEKDAKVIEKKVFVFMASLEDFTEGEIGPSGGSITILSGESKGTSLIVEKGVLESKKTFILSRRTDVSIKSKGRVGPEVFLEQVPARSFLLTILFDPKMTTAKKVKFCVKNVVKNRYEILSSEVVGTNSIQAKVDPSKYTYAFACDSVPEKEG